MGQEPAEPEVGRTKDAGFQIGVSKTVPYAIDTVWGMLTSPEGIARWLGDGAALARAKGTRYETSDGTTGEIRSFRERDRIRLTWRPRGWDHDTTVQVAVTGHGEKTLLRFHQEWLADGAERERQREHWRAVMTSVVDALAAARS